MENEKRSYHVMDTCVGVVQDRCAKGIFVRLDNGETAFAYGFTYLVPGSVILCSVCRRARENVRMLVAVDSVSAEGLSAA